LSEVSFNFSFLFARREEVPGGEEKKKEEQESYLLLGAQWFMGGEK
jgi:hypothetical protein